jgi:hypothetical protein
MWSAPRFPLLLKSSLAVLTKEPGSSPESRAPSALPGPARRPEPALRLRAGEWVEVLPLQEIFETLDGDGSLDGLPFMPEMAQYCGRRFRVFKSAHKTCDTIEQYVIRRMENAVHLEGLRCDGAAHGGCQALCLIFWKEAWLKRVDHTPDLVTEDIPGPAGGSDPACAVLHRASRPAGAPCDGHEYYRCQATEVLRATTEVKRRDRWDPRFYLRDLTSGNVSVRDFVWYGGLAIVNAFMYRWRGKRYPHLCGLAGSRTPTADQQMQVGELVRVRSKNEIMQTLNSGLRNRGLWFDVEMAPYCGSGPFRVLRRVERIVDEKTGRLVRLPNPCLILDNVTCGGNLSMHRMFCPRTIYPYWREIWLEPAEHGADEPLRRRAQEGD